MDQPNEKHPFQQLCEDLELNVRSYSGRGMYGKECLGIVVGRGDLGNMIADVIEALQDFRDDNDDPTIDEVARAFRRMTSDSMGMGSIYYFPGIPYVAGDEEDDPEIETDETDDPITGEP